MCCAVVGVQLSSTCLPIVQIGSLQHHYYQQDLTTLKLIIKQGKKVCKVLNCFSICFYCRQKQQKHGKRHQSDAVSDVLLLFELQVFIPRTSQEQDDSEEQTLKYVAKFLMQIIPWKSRRDVNLEDDNMLLKESYSWTILAS